MKKCAGCGKEKEAQHIAYGGKAKGTGGLCFECLRKAYAG